MKKMEDSIEAPRSALRSIKKSLSVFTNLVRTPWYSKNESDIICKEFRRSNDVESSIQGFKSTSSTECLTDICGSSTTVTHLPLHYDNIKFSLIELRKFNITSGKFHYPDEIEWQSISNENFKYVFKDANLLELNNAFLWAAFTERWTLLQGFLELGAQLNYYESNYGLSALHLAAFSGCKEGTEFLLHQKGSDPNIMHKCYTPLHCAAFGNSPETAKILMDYGANIQTLTNDLYCGIENVLHCSIRANAVECLNMFCNRGANINQPDSAGRTPIHLAAELGCTECLSLLVKVNGANVNVQTKEKKFSALHYAAQAQHLECIDVLLENGAFVDLNNSSNQTALHLAAKVHSNECLKILLKKGKANPNAQDIDQRTPLHVAVSKTYRIPCSDTLKTLIRHGAEVNAQDNQYYRPLHLAAINELSECAETLILNDADITAKDKNGVTALRLISEKIPLSVDAIRKKLDESISFAQQNHHTKEFELRIDFTTILKYCHPREVKYLQTLVREGQKELLLHPVCTAIYTSNGRKSENFILIYRVIFFLIFAVILSSYVLLGIAKNCYNVSKNVSDSSILNYEDLCFNTSLTGKFITKYPNIIEFFWYILATLCCGIFIRKMCSISGYSSLTQYFLTVDNMLDWGCIITVFLISFVYTGRTQVWQNHVSAFGVLICWVNLYYILGQFPVFGTYVAMYTSVQYEFAKLLFLFSFLLIGFSVSFCVLFPNSQEFPNMFVGYITVLVMSIGEMNFSLITNKNDPNSLFQLEGSMQIVYLIFVTCVTIILLNLLVGIAVHDIQGLRKSARLTKLIKQAQLISHIEKAIFNDYFHKKVWLDIFRCTSLISAKGFGVLTVKPLHQQEKRLPKHILMAAFAVARKQKKKNRPSFKQSAYLSKRKMFQTVNNKRVNKNNNNKTIDVGKIESEFNSLKNSLTHLNTDITNMKNILDSNQRIMKQILYIVSNKDRR